MTFAHFDSTKVIPYLELKKSSQAGCVNVILPDGRVLSAQSDGSDGQPPGARPGSRPEGTDGPWEQGMVSGNSVLFLAAGEYVAVLLMPSKELPR